MRPFQTLTLHLGLLLRRGRGSWLEMSLVQDPCDFTQHFFHKDQQCSIRRRIYYNALKLICTLMCSTGLMGTFQECVLHRDL